MGFLDATTSGRFKRDKAGNTLFYPWGFMGKGRRLPDGYTTALVRDFVGRYDKISFVTLIAVLLFAGWKWSMLLFPFFLAWYFVSIRRMLHGCPVVTERLSLLEVYSISATSYSEPMLWFLLADACFFVLAMLYVISRAKTPWDVLLGVLYTGFFGMCAALFVYMIRAKRRSQ